MRTLWLVATFMIVLSTSAAQAQVSIDVAKISCDQFTGYRITDPKNIAIWLSGFYSGKRDNMVIDTQVFNENYVKLRDFCITNPSVSVVQAVQRLFGTGR